MLSKTNILTSLVLSIGIFGVSIGVIGGDNFLVNLAFLVITLIVSLVLFAIYKPSGQKVESSKGYDRLL